MPKTLNLKSLTEAAKKTAKTIKGGEIFGLIGPLGSGKTAFVKNLGQSLKIKHSITSPTFVLMNRYKFRKNRRDLWLYHLDIYRLKTFQDVKALGLEEIWGRPGNVVIIEWAEKIKKFLPAKTKKLYFKHNF